MDVFKSDVAIVGAGGAGPRAAIAMAEADPSLTIADSRDAARADRMQLVNAEEGVWSCTAVGYCSEVCPKGVDPANAVNQNKTASAADYFLNWLPKGGGK